MYGYRMAVTEQDQLAVWFLFRSAIALRAPVKVSFCKRRHVDGKLAYDKWGVALYEKVTRTVEPYELRTTRDGRRVVEVIDRCPNGGDGRPDYRTLRLDRVTISQRTKRPMVQVLWSRGFLCPSPLDGRELYPRKGTLTGRKPGIMLAWGH